MSNNEDEGFVRAPIQKMVEDTQKDSTVGPLIGSVIVILVIIIGGLYFWGTLISSKKVQLESEQKQADQIEAQQIEDAAKQSGSDDVNSIDADIRSTDIDSLDSGVNDIDKEF